MKTSSDLTNVPVPTPASRIIVHQDNSPLPNGIILNETNYSLWSQIMKMQIGARNKVGYLTGEVTKPAPRDLKLAIWITKYHRVKNRLIDFMSPSLMQ
jgi:hypothetical protein